jgi:hypothetical protein
MSHAGNHGKLMLKDQLLRRVSEIRVGPCSDHNEHNCYKQAESKNKPMLYAPKFHVHNPSSASQQTDYPKGTTSVYRI